MRHRDKVVSKGEIVRAVWDTSYDGDEKIVEVYVRYLRRKIDLAGHNIETVRGVATDSSAASGSSTTKDASPRGNRQHWRCRRGPRRSV
jgi:hypothetical protein